MPNKQDFIKYGKWDTIEHARNGAKDEKQAQARFELYKIHQKAKKELAK